MCEIAKNVYVMYIRVDVLSVRREENDMQEVWMSDIIDAYNESKENA